MQHIFGENVGADFSILVKHSMEYICISNILGLLTVGFDQLIGFLHLFKKIDAGGRGFNANKNQFCLGKSFSTSFHKSLEILQHLLRRITGIEIIVTLINKYLARLVGIYNLIVVSQQIGKLRPAKAPVNNFFIWKVFF